MKKPKRKPAWTSDAIEDITARKRAVEEASRMVTVVRDSNDAITIQDFEGRITAWNRGAELMFGYSEQEALKMKIWQLAPPDKAAEQKDFNDRLFAGEKVTSFETQRLTKDGRRLDVWLTVTKLVDDAGKVIGIASTERDITARKRAVEEASRMVTVVRDSNDAITIQDFEGRITAWNRGAELMYGYSEEEALLLNIERLTAPGKVAEQEDFNRRLFAGEKITSFETQRLTKDGRLLDVWLTVTRLVDDAGKVIGIASTERDITENKQAVERIREQAALLDKANDAIYVKALDHTILYWNRGAERTYGWTSTEVLNRKTTELISPDHAAMEALTPVLLHQGSWTGERRQRTKSGGMVEVFSRLTLVRNEQGQPQSVFAIDTDITELVRAREAAESATKAKSQFLAMMSHEIRTPMNGVLGFANLLADTRLDEQQRDFLRTIVTSGESLLTILNDILNFSKLEAGRTELEARPVALRLLVEGVLDLLAAPARAKSLELVYWIEPDVPEGIVGDATGLRQILLNFAGNALKFTPAGHVEISIAGAPPGADGTRQLVFHVRDTGIGIPPEQQDRLFKAFSQVDASITRNYGGTGLGLAISQRLVTLMGGEIGVTSEPGKGSDFHFTLRVAEADVTDQLQMSGAGAPQEIAAALRGRRVLIVDDSPANLRLLDKILSQYGAGMVTAHSGAEVLAALERQRFDLAVLNYIMPGADGVALATAIRQRADTARLPLILVTSAQPSQTETPPGLFAAVIPKPLHNRQFASAVAQALLGSMLGWPEPPTANRGELLRQDQMPPPHRHPL